MVTCIGLNVLTTSLIAGRIIWQKRTIRKAFGDCEFSFLAYRLCSRVWIIWWLTTYLLCSVSVGDKHESYYDRVVTIIIESGLVSTAALIVELVLYAIDHTGARIIIDIQSQLVVRACMNSIDIPPV